LRKHPITGIVKLHNGIDFGGTFPVRAAHKGKVVQVGYNPDKKSGYGHYVVVAFIEITARGIVRYQNFYAHGESKPSFKVGHRIKEGDSIFTSGSTGASTAPHLHFELRKKINGSYIPLDPARFL
jgi:murein DD-endopeptidase MepM/ murein hydrolase activator NlpD